MRIVHGSRMDFTERHNPRGGTFHYKRLVEGTSGTPGNFGLMLSRTFENFVSPRHRHNFEQIRFQIEGVCDFARDGSMTPGTMGYFPEGAYYGPQSAGGPALVAVLQFGGPSRSGYMSEDDLQRSVAALSQVGRFEAGVFHRAEGQPGRARQDAYEAAWEHHTGRRMTYPEPLHPAPILVGADAAPWQNEAPGRDVRTFGTFKGGTAVRAMRLQGEAQATLSGPAVLFVLSGAGFAGESEIAPHDGLHIETGETVALHTNTAVEVLVMQLPLLATAESIAA